MIDKDERLYALSYADNGTALVLNADLGNGWRKRKDKPGYGFYRKRSIYCSRAGCNIWTQLNFFTEHDDVLFPDVSFEESGDKLVSYSLDKGLLQIKVTLNDQQPWRPIGKGRHRGLYITKAFSVAPNGSLFDLQVHIAFQEDNRKKPAVGWEWCQRPFVPGGQFESNRQRH